MGSKIESKVCCRCGLEKPMDDFFKANKNEDGRTGACRDCIRIRRREIADERSPNVVCGIKWYEAIGYFLLAICLTSCRGSYAVINQKPLAVERSGKAVYITPNSRVLIYKIDGCEYLFFYSPNNFGTITHKENCTNHTFY